MFEILPESTDKCIGFRINGEISAEDYDSLLPKLDEAIASHGTVNLLMVMGDFEGFSGLDAAKADFKLGTHQYRQVEKAAFIGSKNWQKWIIGALDPFTRRTDERYFNPDELDAAWDWIKEE